MMHTDQWNIIEGHRKMMTKGNEIGKECYLGRRVFNIKGNSKDRAYQKGKGLPYSVSINV